MKLFENYAKGIESILDESEFSDFGGVQQKRSKFSDILIKGNTEVKMFAEQQKNLQLSGDRILYSFDRDGLKKIFGPNESSFSDIVIGSHPDFLDLSYDDYCYHHCVSMFVDIKGSTRLALKNKLEKVRLIKDSLLTLCIHVSNFFGGHIHRLQGDAVFVQFVRKGRHKNDAIINALNASAVLCQFVDTTLKEIFLKKELNPIKIRVGIDYGSDNKVMWSHYGVQGCTELTTTSLHTDLAAKLQSKAGNNSIIIGGNIVDELDLPDEFYRPVYITKNGVQEIERYIINEISYKQYEFNWRDFLLSYDFIKPTGHNNTLEITNPNFQLICELSDEGQNPKRYYQNSSAIPKGKSIKFSIMLNNHPYHKQMHDTINWSIVNRGREAMEQGNQKLEDLPKNVPDCTTHAAYLGHHYVVCKITRPNLETIRITFPVFVQD